MIGLVHDQPDDPLIFIEKCTDITRSLGGTRFVKWDSFIGLGLPSVLRNVSKRSGA